MTIRTFYVCPLLVSVIVVVVVVFGFAAFNVASIQHLAATSLTTIDLLSHHSYVSIRAYVPT